MIQFLCVCLIIEYNCSFKNISPLYVQSKIAILGLPFDGMHGMPETASTSFPVKKVTC